MRPSLLKVFKFETNDYRHENKKEVSICLFKKKYISKFKLQNDETQKKKR